jgi:hypothetical protein
MSNNVITDAPGDGINVGADSIVIGNRVINSGRYGIATFHNNTIIANNRVSDSSDTDISNQGSGTVLDGNLTT